MEPGSGYVRKDEPAAPETAEKPKQQAPEIAGKPKQQLRACYLGNSIKHRMSGRAATTDTGFPVWNNKGLRPE